MWGGAVMWGGVVMIISSHGFGTIAIFVKSSMTSYSLKK